MSLLEWLLDVAACRENPERLCFDGLEEGLRELRARPVAAGLHEMGDLLASLADELELFLDSGMFYHIDQSVARARDLALLCDGLQEAA